jgi:MFS family permease
MRTILHEFTPDERRNTALNAVGEALWGFQTALVATATVFTVLVSQFGASPRLIGAIPAVEGTLIVLPQIVGMTLLSRASTRRRNLVIWHLAVPIPALFAMGILLLSPARENAALMRIALFVGFAAFVAGIGAIVSVWIDWLADLFRMAIRGTAIGIAFGASALSGTAGGLLAGAVLNRWPHLGAYAALYLAAGTIAALSFVCFALLRDPAEGKPDTSVAPSPRETWRRFRLSLGDRNFGRYLIGRGLMAAGFAVTPFIAIHFQSPAGGALTDGTVVAAGAGMAVGSAIGNLGFGWLGDRFGHRVGVIAGACMQALTLAILLTGAGLWNCVLCYFCTGVCVSSAFVSHSNLLYETCPHDHRVSHITLGNMVLSVPMMLGGLLAGQIAHAWGLRPVFGLCLVLSLGAAAWLLLAVREPRDTPVHSGDSLV